MESTFHIKLSELNINFLEGIKKLFGNEREIQITVSSSTDFDLNVKENNEEYFSRLEKALTNLKEKKSIVSLSEDELDKFSLDRIIANN